MQSKSRINALNLLRFIAAMMVVFFHYSFRGFAADGMTLFDYSELSAFSKYGYLGVQLFFMISGFVILMSALKLDFVSFVINRISRLYPVYWVCVTLTFLVIIVARDPRYFIAIYDYLINLTMLNGIIKIKNVDGAYWSLLVELFFYALVSVALFLKLQKKIILLLYVWLASSCFLLFYNGGNLIFKIARIALLPSYSSYFVAGMVFYLVLKEGRCYKKDVLLMLSYLVSVTLSMHAIPGFIEHYNANLDSYIIFTIISVFYCIFFVISYLKKDLMHSKILDKMGMMTYPLYLIHQNIGFIIFNKLYVILNRHILFWGLITLMLCFSYIITTYVEKPIHDFLKIQLYKCASLVNLRLAKVKNNIWFSKT